MKTISVFSRRGEDRNEDLSFRSIVELHKKGYISSKDVVYADDDRIQTPLYEFVKSTVISNSESESKNIIDKQGASWFANFRGVDNAEDNAAWQKFVEKIADYFHRKFSFLEYAEVNQSKLEKQKNFQKLSIRNVMAFFIGEKPIQIEDDPEGCFRDDIYGAVLKLNITDGTGEAKPVVGKVIFRNKDDGRGLEPITVDIFSDLKDSLSSFEGDEKEENEEEVLGESSRNETVIAILNALDDLLNKEEGFQDYISFEDERDQKAIEYMVSRGPNHVVDLECRYAEVLSVFHLNWVTSSYIVSQTGLPTFKVNFGVGNRMSVSCMVCSDPDKLINNNRIFAGETRSDAIEYVINPELNNLGLDPLIAELVKKGNPFHNHAFEVSCKHTRFETECRKFACLNKIFKVTQKVEKGGISTKILCRDCPYPEIVSEYDGKLYYTPDMVFCRDTMSLKPREETGVCKICGRTFSALSGKKGGTCDFCKEASSSTRTEYSKKLYKKYSVMLPIKLRLQTPSSGKKCVEDEEILLFNLSGKLYLQNKADLNKVGFLENPLIIGKKENKEKK